MTKKPKVADGPWSFSGQMTYPWPPLPEPLLEWENAIAAFPDVEPLIRLLRDDHVPMARYVRQSLANLLSPPTDPPTDAFCLELRVNNDFEKMMHQIFRASEYNRRMGEAKRNKLEAKRNKLVSAQLTGKRRMARSGANPDKSKPIALEVGRQFGNVQDRQVLRDKREWEETLAKDLRDRLRGTDPKSD